MPPTPKPALESALDVARRDILGPRPVRETGGKNRSPRIDALNRGVGIPLGSPYCAAGVSAAFREFAAAHPDASGTTFPYGGGSQAIRAEFARRGSLFVDPDRLLRCRGALFGWTNEDGAHGHVGFVEGRLIDGARVVGIRTLEYNTSPRTKGRDGEGAYALTRVIAELRDSHPRFWFVDVSGVRGGRWWA